MEKNSRSETVNRITDYIDAHLHEPITANDLAKAAGYSQYHMIRVFKKETGMPPFEYIRQKRLISSAFELRRGKLRVIDVALDFVFDSHEGFTRAFSNAFGIPPKRFAKFPEPYGWLIPYRYLDRQKNKSEECTMETKSTVIFTQIIERPARKLLVYRSKNAAEYFGYNEEIAKEPPKSLNGTHPWDYLCGIKEALYEPVGVWLPKAMRLTEKGVYAHAVEVPTDYSADIPEGFDLLELPPCKYLIFQGEPYDDDKYGEAVGACMSKIGRFDPKVYGYEFDDDTAPRFQLAPMGWRGYIEGRPIKEIK